MWHDVPNLLFELGLQGLFELFSADSRFVASVIFTALGLLAGSWRFLRRRFRREVPAHVVLRWASLVGPVRAEIARDRVVEASFSSPRQMAVVHGVQGDLSDAARTNREMFEERRQALGAELGMFSLRLGLTLGGEAEFARTFSRIFTRGFPRFHYVWELKDHRSEYFHPRSFSE